MSATLDIPTDGHLDRVELLRASLASDAAHLESLNAEVEAVRGRIRTYESELRELLPGRRKVRKASDMDPAVQAGHANVEKLRTVFASRRRLSQAAAAREAGLSSGTTTWAVRALLREGSIEETDERDGVSRVFRYVPRTRRTRLGPGE